jgi:hypothetical protein
LIQKKRDAIIVTLPCTSRFQGASERESMAKFEKYRQERLESQSWMKKRLKGEENGAVGTGSPLLYLVLSFFSYILQNAEILRPLVI